MNKITRAKLQAQLNNLGKKHNLTIKLRDNGKYGYKHYIRVADNDSYYDQSIREKNLSNWNAVELNLEYAISMLTVERRKNDYKSS
jgi:hypothetical protein